MSVGMTVIAGTTYLLMIVLIGVGVWVHRE